MRTMKVPVAPHEWIEKQYLSSWMNKTYSTRKQKQQNKNKHNKNKHEDKHKKNKKKKKNK